MLNLYMRRERQTVPDFVHEEGKKNRAVFVHEEGKRNRAVFVHEEGKKNRAGFVHKKGMRTCMGNDKSCQICR